jgi:RecB family exonuclease
MSLAAVRHYESGRRRPSAAALLALAEALGVRPEVILPTPAQRLAEFSDTASDHKAAVWSYSRISAYLRCPAYFKFHYVDGLPYPPTPEQALGSAVHKAIEQDYLAAVDADRAQDPAQAMQASLEADMAEAAPDPETGETVDLPALLSEGKALLAAYRQSVAPTVKPRFVEQKVEFQVGGVSFQAVIDLATADGWIRNTKTATRKPSDADLADNLQATAESLGYRALTGEAEQGVAFDYLLRRKKGPEVTVLTTTRGPADHDRLARIAEGVAEAVAHGHFYPNPQTKFGCKGCPFRAACMETYR